MTKPYEIELYRTVREKEPYTEWEKSLDKTTMTRIDARLARIRERGNIGNCRPLGLVTVTLELIQT
jgi:putative component of toxin-antitoxin plasmid stabilization module